MTLDRSKIFFLFFIISISIVCSLSIYLFKPIIDSDGLSYADSIRVLQGKTAPVNFVPNRILTSFLGLQSVILFDKIFGSEEFGWLMLNIFFFFFLNIIYYKLILNIFKSEKTAFLGSLFLATNYAVITFGLDYWMDIGGWVFYILSLYLTFKYIQTGKKEILLYSALSVGVGGLFKEYAFLATIVIAMTLVYENLSNPIKIFKKSFFPALLVIIPFLSISIFVYEKFNYTYSTWFSFNKEYYIYASRLTEYIKSLGSLYTFLAFLIIGGAYYAIYNQKRIISDSKTTFFIFSVIVSTLPVFIWSAITQRILFITVLPAILIACFLFKKFENYWLVFIPVLILYAVINFTMTDFILPILNLPF